MDCKFNYASQGSLLTGTVGVAGAEQVFRLSSLYDPDFTNAGHQPYGFDQMAALYRKYLVRSVEFEITVVNPSEDAILVAAMIQPSAGSQVLTGNTADTMVERPNVVTKILNNTGEQRIIIRQPKFALHLLEGVSRDQFENDLSDYGADTATNPNLTPYLRMAIASLKGDASASVQYMVKIVFSAHFYERIGLGGS
jgi:hypothetical protein